MSQKLKDLLGQRVGAWSVVKRLGSGRWECVCDCGAVKAKTGTELRQSLGLGCKKCATRNNGAKRRKYATAAQLVEATRERQRAWHHTEKGRRAYERFLVSDARQLYLQSERKKSLARANKQSEPYKEKRRAYRKRPEVRSKELAAKREFRQRHGMTEAERARLKRYRESERGKTSAQVSKARRRVRESGSVSTREWRLLCELWGGCAYCGSSGHMTLDHCVPVSRGGTTSLDNVVPACGTCNYKKWARTPEESAVRLGLDLEKFESRRQAIYTAVCLQREAA